MIRWMCGVKLNERKKSEEVREFLGLEPVSLMIEKVWTCCTKRWWLSQTLYNVGSWRS